MKSFLILLLLAGVSFAQGEKNFMIEMPSLFSDNMVLQQKSNVPFWGKAFPQTNVDIKTSWGSSAKTMVGNDGNWITKVKTPKAGGPYEVAVKIGDSTIVYKNVLIGEVWLCSGQSNMEMPLAGWPPRDTIFNSASTIANAGNSNIRLFTVPRTISSEPNFNCGGTWLECNSETVASFSATAYFFGKKLHDELKIPIGLIHSSWGGTPAEAWISGKDIVTVDEFENIVTKINESGPEILLLNLWLNGHKVIDMSENTSEERWMDLDFQDSECSQVNYDDSRWREMILPTLWENTEVGNFDGAVWFRKKVEIPNEWLGKDLILSLGPIDDMDITFVNGIKIGGYEKDGFWETERVYTIDKNLNKDSVLSIAVRVLDNQGGGGIYGTENLMTLSVKESGDKISIAGEWKYLPVAEYRNVKFYVFGAMGETAFTRPRLSVDLSANTPTTLFNGMIAPLRPYGIKGAIWYQGESNVGNPKLYQRIFPMMIECWRDEWQEGNFPFYYVQIAPYNYGGETNSQLLRESQMRTLKTPNTGMAVTMDIGNPDNIHPGNKEDVGERLALWALAKNYNKKVVCSGPLYKSMKIQKDKIVLSFDFATGLEIKPRDGKNNFQIAGKDKVFHDAVVEVKGKTLVVSSPDVKEPVAVRYCWSDIHEGTLFNNAGLPASSFRTDDWE
ncbi:MAG: sialate O-acetylesterase [bacterium]